MELSTDVGARAGASVGIARAGALGGRIRWALARRPWLGRSIALALAASAGAGVHLAQQSVERARTAWGDSVTVLVATEAVAPGDPLAATVAARTHPRPLVPLGALRELPPGAIALQRITPGEVVVTADVSVRPGPLALVPPGWHAVAITLPSSRRPPLSPADRVGVIVAGRAATEGIVAEAEVDHVVIAVAPDVGPEVAWAAAEGAVAITLVAGEGAGALATP